MANNQRSTVSNHAEPQQGKPVCLDFMNNNKINLDINNAIYFLKFYPI